MGTYCLLYLCLSHFPSDCSLVLRQCPEHLRTTSEQQAFNTFPLGCWSHNTSSILCSQRTHLNELIPTLDSSTDASFPPQPLSFPRALSGFGPFSLSIGRNLSCGLIIFHGLNAMEVPIPLTFISLAHASCLGF